MVNLIFMAYLYEREVNTVYRATQGLLSPATIVNLIFMISFCVREVHGEAVGASLLLLLLLSRFSRVRSITSSWKDEVSS